AAVERPNAASATPAATRQPRRVVIRGLETGMVRARPHRIADSSQTGGALVGGRRPAARTATTDTSLCVTQPNGPRRLAVCCFDYAVWSRERTGGPKGCQRMFPRVREQP